MDKQCKGRNCGSKNGEPHSAECVADHEAATAGLAAEKAKKLVAGMERGALHEKILAVESDGSGIVLRHEVSESLTLTTFGPCACGAIDLCQGVMSFQTNTVGRGNVWTNEPRERWHRRTKCEPFDSTNPKATVPVEIVVGADEEEGEAAGPESFSGEDFPAREPGTTAGFVYDPDAREATTDQPKPSGEGGRESVSEAVLADFRARIAKGVETYGEPLHTFNGRRMLVDAYQEALDLAHYLKGEIMEREKLEARLVEAYAVIAGVRVYVEELKREAQGGCFGVNAASVKTSAARRLAAILRDEP